MFGRKFAKREYAVAELDCIRDRDYGICSECQMYHSKGESEVGECRNDSPMADLEGGPAIFPIVRETDGCGEFQPRL